MGKSMRLATLASAVSLALAEPPRSCLRTTRTPPTAPTLSRETNSRRADDVHRPLRNRPHALRQRCPGTGTDGSRRRDSRKVDVRSPAAVAYTGLSGGARRTSPTSTRRSGQLDRREH